MAKVNVKFDEKAFAKEVRDAFNTLRKDKTILQKIGLFLVERLRAFGKAERPYNSSGDFPLLKESTIRTREYLAKYNKTDVTFEEGKSNITLTGQLWNSLSFIIDGALVIVGFKDSGRRPYKSKNGPMKLSSAVSTNKKLGEVLSKKGFVAFDSQTIKEDSKVNKRINAIVKKELRKALIKLNSR